MGRRLYMSVGRYPVDSNGFPVPIEETRVPYIESETIENHHMAWRSRLFGQLAIAQTFRDLQVWQIAMTQPSHTITHQLYEGIQLPPVANMLGYIEHAQYTGEKLNIREPYNGYQLHDITDDRMSILHDEYNAIHHHL